jgi:hypothetical protein
MICARWLDTIDFFEYFLFYRDETPVPAAAAYDGTITLVPGSETQVLVGLTSGGQGGRE